MVQVCEEDAPNCETPRSETYGLMAPSVMIYEHEDGTAVSAWRNTKMDLHQLYQFHGSCTSQHGTGDKYTVTPRLTSDPANEFFG